MVLAAVAAAVAAEAWPTAQDALIEKYRAACADLAAEASKAEKIAIEGEDGWLFIGSDLRHMSAGEFWGEKAKEVSRASRPDWADPLAAIVHFNDQLKALDIELILVPMPPKAAIYADKLPHSRIAVDGDGRVPRVDPQHQTFYKLLGEKGVQVVDLAPLLLAERAKKDGIQPYCKTDTHYSPAACEMIAKLLAEKITKQDWCADAPKSKVKTEKRMQKIAGDLARAMNKDKPATEELSFRFVELEGADIESKDSPVLLLGDSHTLVFHVGGDLYTKGAGLADQLAAELKMPIDLLGVRGSGATPARISLYRRSAGDPKYLDGKKVVVWCFTAREFTEAVSGWRVLPVRKASQ